MDKHVFISYKHDDSDFADSLILRVQREGFSTWLDNESLHPGDDWREGIDQAIRSAFALIVIISPDAKASEYVTYEWAFAWGCGIKVIPVMYKKTDLHPRLGSLQYLDFTNRIRPWEHLMRTLRTEKSKASDASKSLQVVASQPVPSPFPVVSSLSTEQKVQEWIDKGELFLKRKDYDGALDAFKQAILLDPGNAHAYTGKSTALYELKRHKEALAASEQAIRLDPRYAPAWNAKSDALFGLKLYAEALTATEKALDLDPYYILAWKNKGVILECLTRYDGALSAYEEALGLDPENVLSWNGKGDVLYRLDRDEEALIAYEEALGLDPENASSWNRKGNVLYSLNRDEEAISAYEEALGLDPDDADIWHNKGGSLKYLGRDQEAEQCFKKARDLGYKEGKED